MSLATNDKIAFVVGPKAHKELILYCYHVLSTQNKAYLANLILIRDHHQIQHSPNSLALFATDSLELKLAYTAINEHTNTHKRLIFRN